MIPGRRRVILVPQRLGVVLGGNFSDLQPSRYSDRDVGAVIVPLLYLYSITYPLCLHLPLRLFEIRDSLCAVKDSWMWLSLECLLYVKTMGLKETPSTRGSLRGEFFLYSAAQD